MATDFKNNPDAAKRIEIAKQAKVHILDEFDTASYAIEYAKLFPGLDPDRVLLKRFEDVVYVLRYDKRVNEFKERNHLLNQSLDAPPGRT